MAETDFAWLMEHTDELVADYAGKWIAVAGERVVASGDTASEAAEAARAELGEGADFLLEAIDATADVIYAGL